jgi:hypothetical protein
VGLAIFTGNYLSQHPGGNPSKFPGLAVRSINQGVLYKCVSSLIACDLTPSSAGVIFGILRQGMSKKGSKERSESAAQQLIRDLQVYSCMLKHVFAETLSELDKFACHVSEQECDTDAELREIRELLGIVSSFPTLFLLCFSKSSTHSCFVPRCL